MGKSRHIYIHIYILPEEEKYCYFSDIVKLIGTKFRQDTKNPICLMLHLDEFQLGHEYMQEERRDKKNDSEFLKYMIYTILGFKVKTSTQSCSHAFDSKILLIPLLTGKKIKY
jgi:hypothetical protein